MDVGLVRTRLHCARHYCLDWHLSLLACVSQLREYRHDRDSSSKGHRIGRPAGITPALYNRSQARRATQKQLTAIGTSTSRRNDLLADLRIEYLPPTELHPARRRVRKDDPIQAARLDRSIAEFGICVPILIDRDRRSIIHGHGIWRAALRAGLDRIPTIAVDHLSWEKQRLLTIALNRLGKTGVWDEVALAEEFDELIALDEDVLVTGFELAEIDTLLLEDVVPDGDEDEVLPELEGTAVSWLGDLWGLGDHLLLQQGHADDEARREDLPRNSGTLRRARC